MLSDDTISLRHLPRRSSKNRDLPFADNDILKANYSRHYYYYYYYYIPDDIMSSITIFTDDTKAFKDVQTEDHADIAEGWGLTA